MNPQRNTLTAECFCILTQFSEVFKSDEIIDQTRVCHCVYFISIFGAFSIGFIDLRYFSLKDIRGSCVQMHLPPPPKKERKKRKQHKTCSDLEGVRGCENLFTMQTVCKQNKLFSSFLLFIHVLFHFCNL